MQSTGPPRGKYKPRERYNNNMKVVTSAVEVVVYEDDRYVRLTNGNSYRRSGLIYMSGLQVRRPRKNGLSGWGNQC